MAIRVIVTGATGMVGEGVMHVCLQHPEVSEVLIINRKPSGHTHPKLREIIHADFYDLSAIEQQLAGYDACYLCLGISSVGISKEEYYRITYTLTLSFAGTLARINPKMSFAYVSGAGTDSTEKGRSNWARVKGKTENDLTKLGFHSSWAFRPGFIKPIAGLKFTHGFYKYINWLFPVGRALTPGGFCTLQELGTAMINCVLTDRASGILEGKDIIAMGSNSGQ